MKFRNLLRILFPVCALAAASCTNEELVLEVGQTQRGREFAQAFQARFGEIDPNHTWVDGSVGKVTVTTEAPTNIAIYALGLQNNTLLRLKQCVVDGTQLVKYDIPLGCKKVVLRAYNTNFNEYKTLDPTNENEVADMTTAGTRAATTNLTTDEAFLALHPNLTLMDRQKITNVWNSYGSVAPWQTVIPRNIGLSTKYIMDDGWNFYFPNPSGTQPLNIYTEENTNFENDVFRQFLPTSLFSGDEDFLTKTGFSNSNQDTYWQKVEIVGTTTGEDGNNYYGIKITDKNGNTNSKSVQQGPASSLQKDGRIWTRSFTNTPVALPVGTYYNFESIGKRGSYWEHKGEEYGEFYATNIDLNNHSVRLCDSQNFYKRELNPEVIASIKNIVGDNAENKPEQLGPYVTDKAFTTVADGPITITWFNSQSICADYIGYYYTEGTDDEASMTKADKYLLLDAGNNRPSTAINPPHVEGDTYPLTYYDANGNASYIFPKGTHIHFFIVHGRYSSTDNSIAHPQSGYSTYKRQDDRKYLFYDTTKPDGQTENGWTLDAWYTAYSQGGDINQPATGRQYDHEYFMSPLIQSDFEGNYKPTMAFNYAGYNVIGFEDTPTNNDLDWNDCVFILNGNFNIKRYDENNLCFSMCMEDLGGTDDLDYNDLFLTVEQSYEEITTDNEGEITNTFYSRPLITLRKAGGTLPMKVALEYPEGHEFEHLNRPLFEDVHKAFGTGLDDVAINTFDPNYGNGTITDGKDVNKEAAMVHFTDGSDVKCINNRTEITTTFGVEFTKNDIASFNILENMIPYINIYVTYKDGQTMRISAPKAAIVDESNTDRTPYAFWFPQMEVTQDNKVKHILNTAEPGPERVFIGDVLEGFNDWVSNQNANNTKWYHFQWDNTDDHSSLTGN